MSSDDRYTATEIRVLSELVSRQQDSDKSIAERLGMAPSNFAVVKKRLEEKGVYSEQIRVNVQRVKDAQAAGFVWLAYAQPIRASFKEELDKIRSNFPVAYTYGSPDWSLNVDYFKSFEDAEDVRLKLAEFLQVKLGPHLSNYMWKIVPMTHLTTCNYDHRLIKYSTEHEKLPGKVVGEPECEMPREAGQLPDLTTTEKKVLVALRRFPGVKKSEIAKKVGIQQSSLSEVFRALQRKGIINYTRTVNPSRLPNRDIATVAWIDLRQPLLGNDVNKIQEVVDKTPQLHKLHYTKTFLMAVSYFHSLDKAENTRSTLLELFGNNVKSFEYKIVPVKHLFVEHTPYFLEYLFGTHLVTPGSVFAR